MFDDINEQLISQFDKSHVLWHIMNNVSGLVYNRLLYADDMAMCFL